jgi:glycosyltransferase involved in cell wall biosynthesis
MTSKNIRVMQIISNLDIGGAQEVVRTLAENLNQLGSTSVVCTFKDGPLSQAIKSKGIPVVVLPERQHSIFSGLPFILELIEYYKHLKAQVEKYEIDVIQTHLLRSMDFLILFLRKRKGPKVYWTFHNTLFDLREDHLTKHRWSLKLKRFSHHMLYWLGSRKVDGIIAVSQDVKTAILETMFGISSDKVTIIRNCVDIQRYHLDIDRQKAREGLGFTEKDRIGVVVATFKKQKGHRSLIEAATNLVRKYPEFHLLFVGDGELRSELKGFVGELDLEEKIHFLGSRNDVPMILAVSDLFILPSLWEGLPMALIEAMASGLPVVATKVSGTIEVVVDGRTGILVEPGDGSGIESAIEKILGDPDKSREMGYFSQRRVEDLFSARRQAAEYIELFNQNLRVNSLLREIRGKY